MRPPALVHVDLDGALEIYAAHGRQWRDPGDPLFESGLVNALEFFERNGIRATLFAIAERLERPQGLELVREAVRRGHEIASHTVTHPDLWRAGEAEKRRELVESRQRLEDRLGVRVTGFRAPGYRIDRRGLEILAEAGYAYDASAFPTPVHAARLGVPLAALRQPGRLLPGSALLEIPMPEYRPLPFPFNPSYALLLGTRYFRWGLGRVRRRGTPLVLLFHLTDFAAPLARRRLRGLKSRIYTLSIMDAGAKAARCQQMIDAVRRRYELVATEAFVDAWRGAAGGARQASGTDD